MATDDPRPAPPTDTDGDGPARAGRDRPRVEERARPPADEMIELDEEDEAIWRRVWDQIRAEDEAKGRG